MVKPGYYSVLLDKYNIKAELTASERVGFHQYVFPANAETPHVIVDLAEGIGWDAPTETYIQQLNPTTVVGYRFSKGWANDQRVFFAIELSQPVSSLSLFDTTTLLTGAKEAKARSGQGFHEFRQYYRQCTADEGWHFAREFQQRAR